MRRTLFSSLRKTTVTTFLSCFALSFAAPQLRAQSTLKPLLSEEISGVLERDGPEAAQRRFNQIFPSEKDAWEIDLQGMAALGTGYMQKGDMASGETILMMVAAITQETVATSGMGLPAPPPASARSSENGNDSTGGGGRTAASGRGPDLGPARTDLERFVGEYGDDPMHRLWVAFGCTGHLVSGATWGDASPWWLQSVGDGEFTYSDQWQSVEISFEIGPEGEATVMKHNVDGLPARLTRVPLRTEWAKECITPPWG